VPAGSFPSNHSWQPVRLVGTNEVGKPIFVIGIYLVNDDVFIIIYLILTCRIYATMFIPRCLYHEDIRLDADLVGVCADGGNNRDLRSTRSNTLPRLPRSSIPEYVGRHN
jgi:hypothetical protein